MAKIDDYTDLTIRWDGHTKYRDGKITENDPVEVIVQKLEMVLFTNKNTVLGDPELGADLEYYLWQTRISNDVIRGEIVQQILRFVPELEIMGYDLELYISEGTFRDIMEVNITIQGYNVSFVFV